MNKFTSIEPASLHFSNCNPAYLHGVSRLRRFGPRSERNVRESANILIVTTAPRRFNTAADDEENFIDVLILPPFRRTADCRVNRTVKIGYDVCSACYRECSRQPIRVILRESSHAKSGHPEENEEEKEEVEERNRRMKTKRRRMHGLRMPSSSTSPLRDHMNASE